MTSKNPHRALPVRQDAGPGDGEAVVLDAERLHEGHVLLVPGVILGGGGNEINGRSVRAVLVFFFYLMK